MSKKLTDKEIAFILKLAYHRDCIAQLENDLKEGESFFTEDITENLKKRFKSKNWRIAFERARDYHLEMLPEVSEEDEKLLEEYLYPFESDLVDMFSNPVELLSEIEIDDYAISVARRIIY